MLDARRYCFIDAGVVRFRFVDVRLGGLPPVSDVRVDLLLCSAVVRSNSRFVGMKGRRETIDLSTDCSFSGGIIRADEEVGDGEV